MEFNFGTLSNGLRIVHKPTANGQVAHMGLSINAGSRDENPDEQGLADFLEHCLFKGTKKRKAFHILSRMDSVGAELNAYTTKEETVIYASFLHSHFERAMEIISDIALHSTFPEREIAKERDVIVDEIQSYQDNPAELIFDDFEELVFKNHPLGRNILGTEDTVRALKSSDIHAFMGRRYKPSEMVLSSVGNLDFDKILKWAEKYFGQLTANGSATGRLPYDAFAIERKVVEMDTFQAHLILGAESVDNSHPLRTAAILLNNYLGGPAMNSRLNMNIREKHGIAYNIESSYTPYSDVGLMTIYLGTDKKSIERSEALVHKELKQLRDKGMTTTTLHRAKQQLKGQFALSQEGGGNTMLSIGKSLLAKDLVLSTAELIAKIDGVTTSEILQVANQSYAEEKLSVLIYQ